MDLILLSCSGSKMTGGMNVFRNQGQLSTLLSPESFSKLSHLRQELADQIGEPPGPDIGCVEGVKDILFMPAYQRYTGFVYRSWARRHLSQPGKAGAAQSGTGSRIVRYVATQGAAGDQ